MNIKTHIINASGNLTPYEKLIEETITKTIRKMRIEIPLDNIDIIVKEAENPELLKDLDGLGGYCPSGYFVQLSIDVNHPSFRKTPKKILEKSLIHELHHAARRQLGVNIDKNTILECVWSEGLADYFVYLLTGELPKWVIKLDKDIRQKLFLQLKKIRNKKISLSDYENWFIVGSFKLGIPKWTGYALGFEIVKNFLRKNKKISAKSLIGKPVKKVLISPTQINTLMPN